MPLVWNDCVSVYVDDEEAASATLKTMGFCVVKTLFAPYDFTSVNRVFQRYQKYGAITSIVNSEEGFLVTFKDSQDAVVAKKYEKVKYAYTWLQPDFVVRSLSASDSESISLLELCNDLLKEIIDRMDLPTASNLLLTSKRLHQIVRNHVFVCGKPLEVELIQSHGDKFTLEPNLSTIRRIVKMLGEKVRFVKLDFNNADIRVKYMITDNDEFQKWYLDIVGSVFKQVVKLNSFDAVQVLDIKLAICTDSLIETLRPLFNNIVQVGIEISNYQFTANTRPFVNVFPACRELDIEFGDISVWPLFDQSFGNVNNLRATWNAVMMFFFAQQGGNISKYTGKMQWGEISEVAAAGLNIENLSLNVFDSVYSFNPPSLQPLAQMNALTTLKIEATIDHPAVTVSIMQNVSTLAKLKHLDLVVSEEFRWLMGVQYNNDETNMMVNAIRNIGRSMKQLETISLDGLHIPLHALQDFIGKSLRVFTVKDFTPYFGFVAIGVNQISKKVATDRSFVLKIDAKYETVLRGQPTNMEINFV